MTRIRASLSFSFLLLVSNALYAQGVGLRMIEVEEPITGTTVPAAVMYPSSDARPDAETQLGPYSLEAQMGATIATGEFPLILLSHGSGGSMFGHHDLAATLARHGYVVAMPEHAGDSYRDRSGFATDRVMLGRAWQASAVISAVLADAQFMPHIDTKRVGAAGFSAGGYTTLLLLGAKPDFARFQPFCAKYPKTPEICDHATRTIQITIPQPPPTADARVRAAFAMAPLSLILDADGLKGVRNPVFLYTGAKDPVLIPAENAKRISKLLPNLYRYREVEGAGHYVFLAPCSAELAKAAPSICTDPRGIDRATIHRKIAEDAVMFFGEALK
jgi:predicted dienelactone hydrolase